MLGTYKYKWVVLPFGDILVEPVGDLFLLDPFETIESKYKKG